MIKKEYLTVTEISEYLKIPEETIYKFARNGRIPASKVGRYWRFERNLVDQWISQHSNVSPSDVHLLVIDDEPAVRELLGKWLRKTGASVECVAGGEDAVALARVHAYSMIFLDLMMPGMDGVQTLTEIKKISPATEVVVVTAFFESRLMDQALELGPLTVLKKPVTREQLLGIVTAHTDRLVTA